MAEKENKQKETSKKEILVGTRGRTFKGTVIKKFSKRVVIEFEKPVYVKKYERFSKKKTKIHARIPESMDVNVGDFVKVQECRPLSKIIHSVVIEVIRPVTENSESQEDKAKSGDKK